MLEGLKRVLDNSLLNLRVFKGVKSAKNGIINQVKRTADAY